MPLLDPVTNMFPPSATDMFADGGGAAALPRLYTRWFHHTVGVLAEAAGGRSFVFSVDAAGSVIGVWLPPSSVCTHVTCLDDLYLSNLCAALPLWVKDRSYQTLCNASSNSDYFTPG